MNNNIEEFKLSISPDWDKISWDYNTGNKYQNKQDLIAVFYNSYIYYEPKIIKYYERNNFLPEVELNKLIIDFRIHFPKDDSRVKGVNYFDDLIILLIHKYSNSRPLLDQVQDAIKKTLDIEEYRTIFIEALQYDSITKIEAYFKGKFNENIECNPLEIFIDNLERSSEFFKNRLFSQLCEYYNLGKVELGSPDQEKHFEKLTTDNFSENFSPYTYLLKGNFNKKQIELIDEGFNKFKANFKVYEPIIVKGFNSKLKEKQIKIIYDSLVDLNYIKSDFHCFEAIFKIRSDIENFKKVIWLKNKTSLREFFILLNIRPTQKIIKELFSDIKGNEIVLPKPKRKDLSSYYWEMEPIMKLAKIPTPIL